MKKLKEKKVGVKSENAAQEYKPSAREIASFFGAAIVSDRIKLEDNELYNRMATQWKDCSSANEVGNSAQYLHAQSVSSENYHVARNRSHFEKSRSGKPGVDRNRSCNHGATCPFLIHHGKCLKFHTREEFEGAKKERERRGVTIRPRPDNRSQQHDDKRRTYLTEETQPREENNSVQQPRDNASSIFH